MRQYAVAFNMVKTTNQGVDSILHMEIVWADTIAEAAGIAFQIAKEKNMSRQIGAYAAQMVE